MLSLLAACSAYRAPLSAMRMAAISPGDIGTTKPLGVWDPLGLIESRDMRRYTTNVSSWTCE